VRWVCLTACAPPCSYASSNMDGIPSGTLRYLLSNEDSSSQYYDDTSEVGVNGTVSGFTSIYITKEEMTVRFHNQDGAVLYTSSVPPRDLANLPPGGGTGNSAGGGKSVLNTRFVIGICLGLGAYFLLAKKP
jgi:hypothetical protein